MSDKDGGGKFGKLEKKVGASRFANVKDSVTVTKERKAAKAAAAAKSGAAVVREEQQEDDTVDLSGKK